jgi:3-oxoadipate enol-lactonase
MGLININGINLNVNIKGNGHPLVIIHGIGGDYTQLENEISHLAKEFKTIALDCRGHGESDKPENYSLQDHVCDILEIMDHYEIETASLLGVSMGSYIGQGVAIAAPERIDKLILTVPKSNGLTSSIQRLMNEHAKELESLSLHESILILLKYMTFNPEIMKKHIDIFETKLSPAQFSSANKALSNFDFRNELSKIAAKTLVISGKYDGLNPPTEGKICASLIPNATFVEMQYSGHAPIYEEPELYMKIIDDFLKN